MITHGRLGDKKFTGQSIGLYSNIKLKCHSGWPHTCTYTMKMHLWCTYLLFTTDDACSDDVVQSLEERLNGLDLGNEVIYIMHLLS